MAQHIDSVKDSNLLKVSKEDFYKVLSPGDTMFCWGNVTISKIIETIAGGPSHVLMAWLPIAGPWLTIEATMDKGVHVGTLADYVDSYPGDLVLCHRPQLTYAENLNELAAGLNLLDYTYDWKEEVSITARLLIKQLPLIQPKRELYCSGLRYVQSLSTHIPLQKPASSDPTPEDNFTDPSMVVKCALVR